MYLENQESVREKSGKSQGIFFVKVCGNPEKEQHTHMDLIDNLFFRMLTWSGLDVSEFIHVNLS